MAEQTEPQVIVRGTAADFAEKIEIGPHRLSADEPVAFGGTDSGPSPYDLLLGALGSCTSMTIGLYARKRKWPLEHVTVSLRHFKIHAADCEECETKEGKIDHIDRVITFEGDLDAEQHQRLMEIADKCPVHHTLTSEVIIKSTEEAAS